MAKETVKQAIAEHSGGDEHSHGGNLLGPILCWAVVFADIGTSVYYTPGILYATVGKLAGFFVLLTMTVFVLLTLKYAEVTHRYPQGGGVVTVAASALNKWFGALGGMFILVDYFLTAAISSLSGMQYLSVVLPVIGPKTTLPVVGSIQLLLIFITIVMLFLLGVLNWVGVSESAKVSLVGAVIAFLSDLAILFTVFTHISLGGFFSLFGQMFAARALTPVSILVGFAGSFLAFSGLESISQLSPVMKTPRKRVAGMALLMVVLTIGITSPLLTMLSTLLQPNLAADPILSSQLISRLAGHWGNIVLQSEVAISAGALLIFASNTAIIGSYHVFMALSRMDFFPAFVLKRNKLRGTPHYSIALATGIPIIILIVVVGNINLLGDMYAFGLLGAFSLTCLGMDVVRHRERNLARQVARQLPVENDLNRDGRTTPNELIESATALSEKVTKESGHNLEEGLLPDVIAKMAAREHHPGLKSFWTNIEFYLGILTTFLVMLAWTTNLITKPLATAFGGSVTGLGMIVAYFMYNQHKQKGRVPVVVVTGVEGRLPGSVLAVLSNNPEHNDAVIHAAVNEADGRPVVFMYVGEPKNLPPPRMFEMYDPYLYDQQARAAFGRAESVAQKARVQTRFIYRLEEPDVVARVWQIVHPRDTIVAAANASEVRDINPDRIRSELTPEGKVVHLLKRWQ
ncbi:MAG TPA: APC family permease [Ktedonobacteraceae bacterium]|nr:APC family permease [Ktedonobacteraceae bacterium]